MSKVTDRSRQSDKQQSAEPVSFMDVSHITTDTTSEALYPQVPINEYYTSRLATDLANELANLALPMTPYDDNQVYQSDSSDGSLPPDNSIAPSDSSITNTRNLKYSESA